MFRYSSPLTVLSLAPVFLPHLKLHSMEGYDFVGGGGGGGGGDFFYKRPTITRTHDPRQLDILTEYAFFWEIFGGKSYEAADIVVLRSPPITFPDLKHKRSFRN